MKRVYDTAIIGGGAVGTASAYFLSKNGQDVLLMEKGSIADGSSSKCDGNVHVGDSKPGIDTDIIVKSQQLFRTVTKDLDMDVQWEDNDSMYVFESEAELEAGAELVRQKQNAGIPIRLLDKKEVHFEEPNLASDIVGGILIGDEGEINPMLLCVGLARRAAQYGATIATHTEVRDIRRKSGVFVLSTVGQEYYAKNVLVASGVWTPEIGKMVGLEIPIIPRQGQLLVTDVAAGFAKRTITEFGYIMTRQESNDFVRNVPKEVEEYGIAALIEPTPGGTMLIGSSRRFCGFDWNNDDRVIRAMAQRAIRFWPGLKDMNMIRCYAGLRPYTPDHMPIISDTPVEGFYIASGHEGSGIALSMVTGLLIDEIINHRPTSLDISEFRYSRFLK